MSRECMDTRRCAVMCESARMPTRRPSTRPDGLLTPENLVPVERGTRWSCRQCGAERAAAWRRERFTEGFEQLVAVMERGLCASPVSAEKRQRALAMAAAMIGGVAASRAVAKADPKLSNQILRARATRKRARGLRAAVRISLS